MALSSAAGCGLLGGEPPGQADRNSRASSAPEGFTRVSPDGISLAYPQGWKTVKDPAKGWAFTTKAVRDGKPYAQVSVLTDLPKTDDAAVAANSALSFVRLADGFERTGQRSLKIPGADGAYRIDYTYRASSGKGKRAQPKVVQGTDIAVVDGNGQAVLVRITRQKGQLDRSVVERIVTTISITAQ